MAELADDEKDAISHRGHAARELLAWLARAERRRHASEPTARARSRAAAVSIVSNTLLIALKIVAGRPHGLGRDPHRGAALGDRPARRASSPSSRVRRAEEPADASHRYGHEKFENAAAAAEGMLILAGSRGDRLRRHPRADPRARAREPRHRHRRHRLRQRRQPRRLAAGSSGARARRSSPALEGDAAHLRTDAYTSIGVLVGLGAGQRHRRGLAGPGRRADHRRRRSSSPASGSRWARCACSSTRRCPDDELEAIRAAIESFADRGVVGYHQLRTRQAGARRYVDLHVQFRHGTTLEEAHRTGARSCRTRSRTSSQGADVLIHLEPEDRVRPGEVALSVDKLMAAAIATRERHAGVAVVAGEQEDQGRDQADADGDEPGDAGELGHDGALLSRTAMTASLTPALALDFITALAPTSAPRSCSTRAGARLAGAGARWRGRARRLPRAPRRARGRRRSAARSSPPATSATRSWSSPARSRSPASPATTSGRRSPRWAAKRRRPALRNASRTPLVSALLSVV